MNTLKYFGVILIFFWIVPSYSRDPFSFDTSTLPNRTTNEIPEELTSEKKECDTINACKVVSISGRELTLQNQEGCFVKIQLPQENIEEK